MSPRHKCAASVDGLVRADELGITLPHEHLLLDFTFRLTSADESTVIGRPPRLEDRWRLVKSPAGYRENLYGEDTEEAKTEVDFFARAGGRTIVDLTPLGLAPNPKGLLEISRATGLNVIVGSGIYVEDAVPQWVREADEQALEDHLVREVTTGDEYGIRHGAIGEIGIEGPTAFELRALRAAARTQARTGAPVFLHVMSGILPETRPSAFDMVDMYESEGGDPSRLVLCHQDGSGDDAAYQIAMLKKGILLEYDTFGSEGVFAFSDQYLQLPTDTQRIRELARLVGQGWIDQLLISQDICYQHYKRSWGGWGFAHILEALRGRFASAGIDEQTLMHLMVANPARILCFAEEAE